MALVANMASANPTSASKTAFDDRLVELGLELTPGEITKFNSLAIFATGVKFGNANQNQCLARIFNLTREQRNYIVTQTSPLRQPRKLINMTLSIGRKSYGLFQLFTGQVILSDVSQPPDIGVALQGLTSNFLQGAIAATQYPQSSLAAVASGIASQGGWTLDNQATDKNLSNFSYTGTPINGVQKLNDIGGVDAFVDNNTLVLIDSDKAKKAAPFVIDESSGMVGVPQVTQQGVNVTVMANPQIQLGGSVTIKSVMNPAANGTFKVIKINFEIANRDQPFWYILETSNLAYFQGN